MRISQYLLATLKETPAEADVISHRLMLRAGMIRKLSSGIYTWLPTGLRVLQKIIAIVREEMNRTGAQEILMPSVIPAKLWHETGRWDVYGSDLLKIEDRHQQPFCYGPTHEEVITDLARNTIKSYRQLPITFYQIQTKFRDEIRPRFGVIRAREFIMKDAYSFHTNEESLQATYQTMYEAYHRIFTRLKLKFMAVEADTGDIGGNYSHEFQALADIGDDKLLYTEEGDFAANVEIADKKQIKAGKPSPDGQGILKETRGIEVGHIFQVGSLKYSKPMKAVVLNEADMPVELIMGCYGIGISRIVAALIEQNHDDRGIVWPDSLAPFDMVLLPISLYKNEAVRRATHSLYKRLQSLNYEVLFDDRHCGIGAMFADAELLGIPNQIIISERTLKEDCIEYRNRHTLESMPIKLESLTTFLQGI
jgi:prolyl-tRNA synthetase